MNDVMFESYVKKQGTADLYALFQYMTADFNRQFGGRVEAKSLIHSRYRVVEAELNYRAYGQNPYALEAVTIEGESPDNIDLSRFEATEDE